jgi:hypothetical protein
MCELKKIDKLLQAGKIEDARTALSHLRDREYRRYVIGTACADVLSWINHPEYVTIISLPGENVAREACVDYRGKKYWFPCCSKEEFEKEE